VQLCGAPSHASMPGGLPNSSTAGTCIPLPLYCKISARARMHAVLSHSMTRRQDHLRECRSKRSLSLTHTHTHTRTHARTHAHARPFALTTTQAQIDTQSVQKTHSDVCARQSCAFYHTYPY
jgi:hypothetical protein